MPQLEAIDGRFPCEFHTLCHPPVHQHWFNFRLDLDIDGPQPNSVYERDLTSPETSPQNPHGIAMPITETQLKTEAQAQRLISMAHQRRWRITNPEAHNALGQPVSYLLVPGANSMPLAAGDAFWRNQAGFVNAHVWVTPYQPTEQYAAGTYLNIGSPDNGLPQWTQANRSIDRQDLVVWYSLGVTHVPRPEEWPIMSVHRVGFKLVPSGFFNRNPALNLPEAE